MRQITCWIAALALVTTAACKKDDKGGSKPEGEKPKVGDTVDPATKPAGGGGGTTAPAANANGPQVKLVSAGAEPRQALRYAPQQGDKDKLDMVMNMGMEMSMGAAGSMPRVDIPPVTMAFDCEVTSSTPETFELAAAVTDVKVDPSGGAMVDMIQPEMAKFVGMKMTSQMTRRGILVSADVKLPPNVNPQMMQMMDSMKQSLSQATAPFPEEPVGVGAKWEVISNMETNGMKLSQTATFELVALDGGKGTAKISLVQTAPPQDVNAPGMPAGAKARLNHLKSTGSGEMQFDLARVVPQKSNVALKSEVSTSIDAQGQKQNVDMKMDMKMDMSATKVK
jgi:hypothetical protein